MKLGEFYSWWGRGHKMGVGRGRNKPCWCGSDKKYKHCHLHRSEQLPIQPWEAEKAMRASFSVKVCSSPMEWHDDCSGQIVKAHTVPRSGSLNKIARAGHVCAFIPSMANLTKNNGKLAPELVGVNRASTFTGFCSTHDNGIFAPIEKAPFEGTPEQCFLLGYRALARELYTKESSARMNEVRRSADKGRGIGRQMEVQTFNGLFEIGLASGLKDACATKAEYDQLLREANFSEVRAYVIETTDPPPVMCSADWFPSEDFEGNTLQDLMDLELQPAAMSFTSFWGGKGGAIVLQWLAKDDAVCRKFVASLHKIPDARLSSALIRLMFEHFENVHIAPDWWEVLPDTARSSLIDRMALSANPFAERKGNVLADDGLLIPEWPVERRYGVGFDLQRSM